MPQAPGQTATTAPNRDVRAMSDDRPHKRLRDHYHVHPNIGHSHPHHHLRPHHGPAFGKTKVVEVEEPDLTFLLKKSIEQAEAMKRDAD